MDDNLDSIRVVNRRAAMRACDLSEKTWERLERDGDTPPKTRLSEGRVGYRISDLKEWLDRRRECGAAS
jgi:predicted DNA-binding transcriptional regulator AlpA